MDIIKVSQEPTVIRIVEPIIPPPIPIAVQVGQKGQMGDPGPPGQQGPPGPAGLGFAVSETEPQTIGIWIDPDEVPDPAIYESTLADAVASAFAPSPNVTVEYDAVNKKIKLTAVVDAVNQAAIDTARDYAINRVNHVGTQDHSTISDWYEALDENSLNKAANLSDLTDTVAARSNLGLGSAAEADVTAFEAAWRVYATKTEALAAVSSNEIKDGDRILILDPDS